MLPRLPKLTTLYLLSVPLKKADLERVAATCPSLAELDLDGCNIDDESLKPLAELKSLKDLDVSNNTRVTATGIAYLNSVWTYRHSTPTTRMFRSSMSYNCFGNTCPTA